MISISELRAVSRERTDFAEPMFQVIAALETIGAAHEIECGCPAPGGLWACIWQGPAGQLLAKVDFDEELVG